VKVEGTSMTPLISDQERIFINKFVYRFEPDWARRCCSLLVSFGSLEIIYQARVGLPEDTVEIRDGSVYVNGKRLSEPYIPPESAIWEIWLPSVSPAANFRHGRSSDQLE